MLSEKVDKPLLDQVSGKRSQLNADIKIVLHTRVAQSLLNGSWQHGKMGLLPFATMIGNIWEAAKHDDPYAEWYLFKTYQALYDSREKLQVIEKKLAPHLNNIRGIEINACQSSDPLHFPLTFKTPFGFMGAYLITDLDFILRQFLTLQKIGIALNQEDISIKMMVSIIQHVFSLPRYWRHTGVTRKDIEDNNQKAEHAKKLMGDIPESVFKRQIAFTFLPKQQGK